MRCLPVALTFLLLPTLANAYELWLDIDTDDDPTTINEVTEEETATIRLILVPSFPGEMISLVEFGTGGLCEDCESIAHYGAFWTNFQWTDTRFDLFDGIGFPDDLCAGTWSAHVFWFFGTTSPFPLSEPAFVGSFNGVVADPVVEGCSVPAHRLAAIPWAEGTPDYWNFVEIGAVPVPVEAATWGRVKAIYGSR